MWDHLQERVNGGVILFCCLEGPRIHSREDLGTGGITTKFLWTVEGTSSPISSNSTGESISSTLFGLVESEFLFSGHIIGVSAAPDILVVMAVMPMRELQRKAKPYGEKSKAASFIYPFPLRKSPVITNLE